MKSSKFLIVLLLIIGLVFIWQMFEAKGFSQTKDISADKTPIAKTFVAGEIIIKYKNEHSQYNLTAAHQQNETIVTREFPELKLQHLKLPKGLSVSEAIRIYDQNPNVVYAQPNFIYRIDLTPNDTSYSSLYGMTKINAPIAWDTTTGDSSIVVAVIDTGLNYNHEDLSGNVWANPGEIAGDNIDNDNNGYVDDIHGYNFSSMNGDPLDDHSHGSHCSGTIGAVGNNAKGVVGVNWNVKLMGLKIFDSAGVGTSLGVISAFQYVTLMKNNGVNIRVTNNSYSGAPEAADYDQAFKDAIDNAGRAGILNVVAAGNDFNNNDINPAYPSSYNSPSILAVAASDSNDGKPSFSNYGATTVDVAAPGFAILSTVLGNNYGVKSGTSMAAPHTAGAAALLAAADPTLSAASLKATLMNTVDVLPQWNNLVLTGGRINVANAIAQPTVCVFMPSETSKNIPKEGGSAGFNVATATNCTYTAFADQPWVTVTSNPGNGNGSISYTVEPNNTMANRSATLDIGGQTYTIFQSGFGTTAASVTVSGRILSSNGRGISRAVVSFTDLDGNVRRTSSNPFGYYRFEDIAVGETYVFNVRRKGYNFSSQAITINEQLSGLNFVAVR